MLHERDTTVGSAWIWTFLFFIPWDSDDAFEFITTEFYSYLQSSHIQFYVKSTENTLRKISPDKSLIESHLLCLTIRDGFILFTATHIIWIYSKWNIYYNFCIEIKTNKVQKKLYLKIEKKKTKNKKVYFNAMLAYEDEQQQNTQEKCWIIVFILCIQQQRFI